MEIDYSSVIDIAAQVIKLALPLGFIFGITEWILYTFFGFVFGKKRFITNKE